MSRLARGRSHSARCRSVDVKEAYDPVQKQRYVVQQDEVIEPDLHPRPRSRRLPACFIARRHPSVSRIA
jgi:hypothetical protein